MSKIRKQKKYRFATMINETGVPTGSTALNPTAPPLLAQANLPELIPTARIEEMIRKIVEETVQTTQKHELVDETILDTSNLTDLDKTPDIVKAIRDFDGNPAEYTAWRKSAERIFNLYGNLKGTAKYYGILTVVRSKITGQANTALESYNTPLNWTAIKQCLNTHYADKRDISTLEYQLTTLVQGRDTIEYFYQKVYSNFSLILNNISGMELNKNTEDTLIETYRNKALDTFIRGLNGDLPRLLAIREPKTLPEALYMCTRLANQDFRTNYAYSNQNTIPPRNFAQQFNRQPTNNQPSFITNRNQGRNAPNPFSVMQQYLQPTQQYAHLQYRSAPQQQQAIFRPMQQYSPLQYRAPLQQQHPIRFQPTQQFSALQQGTPYPQPQQTNRFQPIQQATTSNAQPPPEPMDVDRSLRSQQLSYANRQKQQFPTERPPTKQFSGQYPRPSQNFHINTEGSSDQNTAELEQMPYIADAETPWEEYAEEYEQQQEEGINNCPDVADIHFLG